MPPSSSPAAPAEPHRVTGAAGRRLRPVAAGYDIQRWPLRVVRAAEESLEGWLLRLSQRYGLHPSAVLGAAGVPVPPQRNIRMRLLVAAHRDPLAATFGVSPEDLVEHRGDLAAALVGLRRRHHALVSGGGEPPPLPRGSSWCPHCLADDGTWRESWTDPLHLACATHRVRLAYMCPRCLYRPFASPRG